MGVPYKTKDGRWILPVVNEYERYWRPFCQAVGAEEIMDDPRYCTKQATFDPKNREDCIRYFEDCFSKLNADEVLPKLEAIDIVVSELAHFKDNHTSESGSCKWLYESYHLPKRRPDHTGNAADQNGCVEQPHAEKAHKIGEDNEKLFKEFDL